MIVLRCPLALSDIPAEARPDQITNREEAEAFLTALVRAGVAWHPEDSTDTVGNQVDGAWLPLFDEAAAARMQELMDQVYDLKGIDPCGVILDQEPPEVEVVRR